MAPFKGKKGALEDQLKDALVMTHFLVKGNSPAYAEQIRRSWDENSESNIITSLPDDVGPREKSLSLSGAIQICERLSSPERAILQKHSTMLGEKRAVVTYTLSETPDGFRRVARAMLSVASDLFLESSYAKNCLNNVWIPEIRRRLRIEANQLKGFDWTLGHSPTALMITLENDFGSRLGLNGRYERMEHHGILGAWAGACAIADALSPSRSNRIALGGRHIDFNVRAHVEGRFGLDLGGEGRVGLRYDHHLGGRE